MICSSVCLLRFIVWSFLKARLLFVLDQFNGATSMSLGSDVAPRQRLGHGYCR
jgi:hypothetical protein